MEVASTVSVDGKALVRELEHVARALVDDSEADRTSLALRASSLLLQLRDLQRTLLVTNRLRLQGSDKPQELRELEEHAADHAVMQVALAEQTAALLDFAYTPQARALLDTETGGDHDGKVAALHAERESRIELIRLLDRLTERKRALEADRAVAEALQASLPGKLGELAKRVVPMQDTHGVALSEQLQLPGVRVADMALPLQRVYVHLAAYASASATGKFSLKIRTPLVARGGAGSVRRPVFDFEINCGADVAVDGKKRNLVLRFDVTPTEPVLLTLEVMRGPSTNVNANCAALACLLPGDRSCVAVSSLVRSYDWLNELMTSTPDAMPSLVHRVVQALEARFLTQQSLAPQLETLATLTVPNADKHVVSRLTAFTEGPPNIEGAEWRVFTFRVECAPVEHVLVGRLYVSCQYPAVLPTVSSLTLEQRGSPHKSSSTAVTVPEWAWDLASSISERSSFARAVVADPVLLHLQHSINTLRPPRDVSVDLSHRMRKLLLAFDLYCYHSLGGAEALRVTWATSRARVVGRDRHIECSEF